MFFWGKGNPYRAGIEASVPPGVELIAAGSKKHCKEHLKKWIILHPPAEYEKPIIYKVVEELK